MAEQEELALRTSGNSALLVQILINLLPVLIIFVVLLSLYLLYYSLVSFHKRPLRSSIAPLFILLLRYAVSRKLPILLEPAVNSSFPPPGNGSVNRNTIFVADLHTDTMLWTSGARSLHYTSVHPFTSNPIGSSDIPRMLKGRIGLQIFAAVTSVPRKMNFKSNPEPTTLSDTITPIVVLQWPIRTWSSRLHRALYQAERLRIDADASDGKLFIVESGEDIRKVGPPPIGAVLAIEGLVSASATEPRLSTLC